MSQEPNESRVHHYVPRSVLRRFSPDSERQYVFVFDKTSGRVWPGGMDPTGSTSDYNTLIQQDGTRLNFEADFGDTDARYANIGDELASRRSLIGLDANFLTSLADVAAVQLLRTPIVRSTLSSVPRTLVAQMRAKGFDAPADDELPDENQIRQSTREMIADRTWIRDALLAKDIRLFEPAGAARFWTSDHPVARFSSRPLGEIGLQSAGVEIYLPIAADLVVGFLCPSLRGSEVPSEGDDGPASIPVMKVLRAGEPLRVSDSVVNFFNHLQVRSSQRFLYGSDRDFSLAREMLRSQPALSANESLIYVGNIGEAPPRPSNMPAGEWLYLESGFAYAMIPIRDYVGDNREMSTDRADLLAQAIAFGIFERAEIHADKGGAGMRGVKIEIINAASPVRFRLAFADSCMQALDDLIVREDRRRG